MVILIICLYLYLFHILSNSNVDEQKDDKKQDRKTVFIGKRGNKKIYIRNYDHVFVAGTTGAGKTVALSNFIASAKSGILIVDGKGDVGENSLLDIIQKLNHDRKCYIINLNDPQHSDKYNPFRNENTTVIRDMLMSLSEWSEEHYRLNTERYLQRVLELLYKSNYINDLETIVKYIDKNEFIQLSADLLKKEKITKEEHLQNVKLADVSSQIAESAVARFTTLLESTCRNIFANANTGIDIYTAMEEKAIILFILNPLLYHELSKGLGKLIIIDSKKAIAKLFSSNQDHIYFIFDEINVYADRAFLNLVNKSRSANVTCVLACQSLSDLDENVSENFREQIIENCNNYIIMRQNSAKNAEAWSNVIGTQETMQITYQINDNSTTGLGSARKVRTFIFHPDYIKSLSAGEAIYVSKRDNIKEPLKINKPF